MLIQEMIDCDYIDYTVYSVTSLKDKYGYRIKLVFNNQTINIKQRGGFSTKTEANKDRNSIISQLENHTYIVYNKIKVNDFLSYWLELKRKEGLKYNSIETYKNIIKNYAFDFFDNLYLANLNTGHFQKFYNWVFKQHEELVRIAKTVMNCAMQYAFDKNLISTNPTINVRMPKELKQKQYRKIVINTNHSLNVEQIKKLIEASKKTPIYLQILFATLMGLRKQEINGLKYADIDFVNRKLYINRQLGVNPNINKEDCKKKCYTKQEIELKTFSSKRVLDIPDIVFEAILEERQKYEKNKNRRKNDKNNPFCDDDYICCSTYGHSRSKGFHTKYFAKLLEENDLPKIRFHDLRHTFATLLLSNNYGLKAVSTLLGHASTIITSNVYFDKNDIVIDCSENLNNYVNRIKPVEINDVPFIDIDINKICNKLLKNC